VTRSAIPDGLAPDAIDAAVRSQQQSAQALFTLDTDRIRTLHPDLLLTQALCEVCAVAEGDVQALATTLTPAPSVVTLGGTTLEGVFDDIRRVAVAVGAEAEGAELLAGLQSRISQVHETLKVARAPRPRMALIEWTNPVYLAGHWGPEQIRRAGGIDTLGTIGAHSVAVTMDTVAASQPEILLFAPCGYTLEAATAEAERCLTLPKWAWVGDRQVWALDANSLTSRPGPRLVDGIETIARIGNPLLFTPLDPTHAIRIR
jgi:iron complex transport system substrate-binding protein